MRNRFEALLAKPTNRELAAMTLAGIAVGLFVKERIQNRHLKHNIRYDKKTGLLSYDYFLAEVTNRTRGTRRDTDAGRIHAILISDLDDFSTYNRIDTHIGTDKHTLILAANGALSAIRSISGEDLVARFDKGADEFIFFLSDIQTLDNAADVARIIRERINGIRPLMHHGDDRRLGVSIGCALLPQGGDLTEALFYADLALNVAKNAGGNQIETFPARYRK
jgi:diguanylate cyclase (GGDEF)-like protein